MTLRLSCAFVAAIACLSLESRFGAEATTGAPDITEFQIPSRASGAQYITGALGRNRPTTGFYFTESQTGKLGFVAANASGGAHIIELTSPTRDSGPFGIAGGPSAVIWFAEPRAQKIARYDGRRTEEYSVGIAAAFVSAKGYVPPVTSYSDLRTQEPINPNPNFWFSSASARIIGTVSPSGEIQEQVLPTTGCLAALASGPDGTVWFTERGGPFVGRLTPDGALTEYDIQSGAVRSIALALPQPNSRRPKACDDVSRWADKSKLETRPPNTVTVDRLGTAWFTQQWVQSLHGAAIGSITRGGVIHLYRIPTQDCAPGDVTVDFMRDGVWFTEFKAGKIGWVSEQGAISEIPLPDRSAGPVGIVYDGQSVWFVEHNANKIGRLFMPRLVF